MTAHNTGPIPAQMPYPMRGPMGPHRPRSGEPGWSIWPRRVWPPTFSAAPWQVLVGAAAAGVFGAITWRISAVSIGYLLTAIAVFAVAFGTSRRRSTRTESFGIALTLALLLVPATRDAGWLAVLCIVASWVTGWLTLTGGRTWTATVLGTIVAWFLPARVLGWAGRGLRRVTNREGKGNNNAGRIALILGGTALLVVVFAALFAGADAAFAKLLDSVTPHVEMPDLPSQLFVFFVVVAFVLLAAYLVRYAPTFDAVAPKQGKQVRRWEWALPLAVLDVLFVLFVAVQLTVLFGGHGYVLDTAGLTYADYARQGFWQLLLVTALTLAVLAAALRKIAVAADADRTLARVLIGVLCATSVVVVASAVYRMWLYEQAYGFTELRLLVTTVELWLGSIFVMIAIAGVRMSAPWLPRAVVWAGVATLLALAAMNPDRFIADRNIDRYAESGKIDVDYLSTLSADAVPALDRLPSELRADVLGPIERRMGEPDPWCEFNLSRFLAR